MQQSQGAKPESPDTVRRKPKDKVSRSPKKAVSSPSEARKLIFQHGLEGLKQHCRVAAGLPIYRALTKGSYERVIPTLDQVLAAQRFVIARMVPELKAVDVAGQMDVTHHSEPADTRQMARAILAALGHGLVDVTPEAPHSDMGSTPKPLATLTDTGSAQPLP